MSTQHISVNRGELFASNSSERDREKMLFRKKIRKKETKSNFRSPDMQSEGELNKTREKKTFRALISSWLP